MSGQAESGAKRGERHPFCGRILMVLLTVVACRTGGPDANGRGDGAVDVDGATERGWVLLRGPSSVDAPPAASDTAAVLTGGGGAAGATGAPPADGGAARAEAGPPPTDNGCVPPVESGVCDPVCDTGCPTLSRCDVADQPRTGRCIGIWISGEGDLCVKTDITDPCAAHLTCVEGACRRLCYRDADCAAPGTCCGQDLLLDGQPSGYKICVACPR